MERNQKIKNIKIVRGDSTSRVLRFMVKNDQGVLIPFDLSVFDKIIADVRKGITENEPLIFSLSTPNEGLEIVPWPSDESESESESSELVYDTLLINFDSDKTILFKTAGKYYADFRFLIETQVITQLHVIIEVTYNITKLNDE